MRTGSSVSTNLTYHLFTDIITFKKSNLPVYRIPDCEYPLTRWNADRPYTAFGNKVFLWKLLP